MNCATQSKTSVCVGIYVDQLSIQPVRTDVVGTRFLSNDWINFADSFTPLTFGA